MSFPIPPNVRTVRELKDAERELLATGTYLNALWETLERHRHRVVELVSQVVTPVYGATVNVDAALGETIQITATNGTAFTIANPSNPRDGRLTVMVRNTSGGALGTVTWGTAYKLATWTSPATGNSRSITFVYDGTNWVEVSRTPADVPN